MEISRGGCSVFLPESLDQSLTYSDQPFIIFEISPFVDQLAFHEIANEIRALEDFDFVFKGVGEKKKRNINLSNLNYVEEGTFKNFCCAVLSLEFFSWFKRTHLEHFGKNMFNFRISNPNKFLYRVIRKALRFFNIPIGLYYTEVEYSSLPKGGFIPPHTDSKNKRLSFVFYLPGDDDLTEAERVGLGTAFWKPKKAVPAPLRRFDCALLQGEERENFYRDHEIFKVSKYEENKAACFIKSDNSWHSVEANNYDYDRRAIVINVYEV